MGGFCVRNHLLRNLVLAALFTAITAVSAQASFVFPAVSAVPFTLQTLAVVLTGALLSPGWAFASLAVYVALGAVGAPVYAMGKAGFGVLLGPTGGYLFSYPLAAATVSLLAHTNFYRMLLATLAGAVVIYLGGGGWAMLVGGQTAAAVWSLWVLPFVPYDLIKVFVAAAIGSRVRVALLAAGFLKGPSAQPGAH